MKMTTWLLVFAAALQFGQATAGETLRVGATPVPHAEILELIKPQLAKQGVDLDIKVFTDYVQGHMANLSPTFNGESGKSMVFRWAPRVNQMPPLICLCATG